MVEDPTLILEEEIDTLIDLYNAEIRHVDESVGVLLDELERLEIADDSLIVITSDHGEEFGEHGDFSHTTTVSSQRSVKLYDELLRVPLIIYNPRLSGHQSRVDTLVSLMDLAPTIVDMVGIEKPEGWLGESLLPLILGHKQEGAAGVISEYEYKLQPEGKRIVHASYRIERWKFTFDGRGEEHKLFDLQKDPRELKNLYESEREMAAELEAKVREHLWRVSMTGEALEEADVEEEVMDRLRGLGYLS